MIQQKKRAILESVASLESAVKILKQNNINEESLDVNFLMDCQSLAIAIGEALEQRKEDVQDIVYMLEKCCEAFFLLSNNYDDFHENASIIEHLVCDVREIKKNIETRILNDKKEIIFLPYKASMWDSMESIWLAAQKDNNVNTYVIPIPYFDRNHDGSLKEWHYEGSEFPSYVPVVDYNTYDLEWNKPDAIFIHNPYDEYNLVTSVHPRYYSSKLKNDTKCLVYVPYFIFSEAVDEHFILTPAVANADYVFVQNQKAKLNYINTLCEKMKCNKEAIENKIVAVGSPKTDKIINFQIYDLEIPDNWKTLIKDKKVILFNTNLNMLLKNKDRIIGNLKRIFGIIHACSGVTIIWREHPLSMSTIDSMIPEIKQDYIQLQRQFVDEKWGILDLEPDPYLSMAISDCYFGAKGSLSVIYAMSGKPIMIMDHFYPDQISEEKITLEHFVNSASKRLLYAERNINSLEIFVRNIDVLKQRKKSQIERQSIICDNLDGTVGEKIYKFIIEEC